MAMKQVKVAEATELQLDWLVARIEGVVGDDGLPKLFRWTGSGRLSVRSEPRSGIGIYDPSTNWGRGGLIIERELIYLMRNSKHQWVSTYAGAEPMGYTGSTPLIAAMRCYAASKLGDTAEVPEELT